MPQLPNIQTVILTYEPEKGEIETLLGALSSNEMIIVDNSPKEKRQTFANFKKLLPVVIGTESNTGYAGGMNRGIAQALTLNADWIVLLTQDVIITKAWAQEFYEQLKSMAPGIVGMVGGQLDPVRWTTIITDQRQEATKAYDYVSGECLAVHRDVLKSAGIFYEPYFMYYEEVDLCLRAKREGFPITVVQMKGFRHEIKKRVGKDKILHDYYLARNHLLFVQRLAPISVKLHEILRMPKTIMEHQAKAELGAIYGIKDYALRRFGMSSGL